MPVRRILIWMLLAGVGSGLGMAARHGWDAHGTIVEMTRRLEREMRSRGIRPDFDRYQAYAAKRLDQSAGTNSFSDKTGNCRLAWFDRLMRSQLTAAPEAARFSGALQDSALQRAGTFVGLVKQGLEKIDAVTTNPPWKQPKDAGQEWFLARLGGMQAGIGHAFEPFESSAKSAFLTLLAAQTLTGPNRQSHQFEDVVGGRRACDGLEKMNRAGIAEAALEAARLADAWHEGWLDAWMNGLSGQTTNGTVSGVTGELAAVWITRQGLIVVGGPGPNVYRLDANREIVAVVDLGGDDRYQEGTVGEDRPVLVLLDRSGNDLYAGTGMGIQGGAAGGVSVLLEGGGDDRYEAVDLAQGSCLAGVGLLADAGGNDSYRGDRRVQGHATGGIGLLWEGGGDDAFRGALLAQGTGGPLGFGLLTDLAGHDRYFAGGKYPGDYDDSPGFSGWSQGVGAGPRGSGNGGIGVLLDGGGDDVYEYDYFCHGGGYWFAVGIARDFGGHDARIGSTRENWDGTPRREKPFVRWGPAFGCHYAMGFLLDDKGDDTYTGNTGGVCFSWDIAVAVLCDSQGDDTYKGGGGGGDASQSSIALLFDGAGHDLYQVPRPGWADSGSAYHAEIGSNSNFALALDFSGQDNWGCGLSNGQSRAQGWAGGMLIDR